MSQNSSSSPDATPPKPHVFHFHISLQSPSLQLLTIHHYLRLFHQKQQQQDASNTTPQRKINISIHPITASSSHSQYLQYDKYKISTLKDFTVFLHLLDEWISLDIPCLLEHLDLACVELERIGSFENESSTQSRIKTRASAAVKQVLSAPGSLLRRVYDTVVPIRRQKCDFCLDTVKSLYEERPIEENPLHDWNQQLPTQEEEQTVSSDASTNTKPSGATNTNQEYTRLECLYASKKVRIHSEYTLCSILKELQDYIINSDNFDANNLVKQLVQCQIYVYVANLVPKHLLDQYEELREFVKDSYQCSMTSEKSISTQDKRRRLYQCNTHEAFIALLEQDESSLRLLLSTNPHQSLGRSAKYFLAFSVVSCVSFFAWKVGLPALREYRERYYPQQQPIVIYIPAAGEE